MSAPVAHTPDALHDVSLQKAVARLNVDLPGAAFAGTPLAGSDTRDRAYILLLSHQATQREADRLRTALAELCGVSCDAPALDLALTPEVAPAEGVKLLIAGMRQNLAVDVPPPTPRTLPDLTRQLTGGQAHGALHLTKRDGDTEVTMMLVDAELDPVRVTYDIDGNASIHADGAAYACLSPGQLELIAERGSEAIRLWDEIIARETAEESALREEDGA